MPSPHELTRGASAIVFDADEGAECIGGGPESNGGLYLETKRAPRGRLYLNALQRHRLLEALCSHEPPPRELLQAQEDAAHRELRDAVRSGKCPRCLAQMTEHENPRTGVGTELRCVCGVTIS